jgi:GT2 family glycosyltransferase
MSSSSQIAPDCSQIGCVVVNWNSASDTISCLQEILATWPELRCIVVDNGSRGDDVLRLRSALPDTVRIVELASNGGYARGVNEGLQIAREHGLKWLWLINPDSRPLLGCLDELVMRSANAVAVGPLQFTSEEVGTTGRVYASAAEICRGRARPITCAGCERGQHDVSVVTGTGLLVGVEAAANAGLMNESFFHYKEEFEFIERLGSFGSVRLVCAARMWHQRGASLSHDSLAARYLTWRNEVLYVRIRGGRWWWVTGRLLRLFARALRPRRKLGVACYRAQLRGVWDGVVGITGPGRMDSM